MPASTPIYILVRRDKLPHVVNSVVGAAVSYTDYSDNKNLLGTVAAVQTLSELTATAAGQGSKLYTNANLVSGAAAGGYVAIKVINILWDDKELTTLSNGLDLADLNALASGGLSIAGVFLGVAALDVAALIIAPLGGVLYLYNSDVNHEKITWEKLWYRYEKTAMFGFTNNLWDTADLVTYESMNIGLGGAQVLRWVISALEDFKPVNPEHRFVTEIYSNNYRDMAINYIYGEKNYNGNEGLRSQTGDLILRNYQLKFIDQLPDALLDQLKTWESNGEDNKVSAYIHALEQINPVVVVNPKIPIEAKTINDVGEEWIKLRTWMIWEYMLNRAIDYHEDKNEKLGTSLEKLKIFNLPYSTFVELGEIAGNEFYKAADNYINHQSKKFYRELIEKVRVIRSQFGLDIDDLLYIEDHVSEQSFHQLMGKPGDIHKLMFAANFTDDSVSGGDTSDMLIASSKGSILNGEGGNDQLIGGSGDDHLNGGRGDDVLFGRKGNDHLNGGGGRNSLQGDEGRDFYYFNTADGDFDDTIIDSDGKGQLIIDGESLLGHFFDPKAGVINAWTAKIGNYDWQAVLTDNGDLILNTLQGNHRITIPGWKAMGNNGLEIILREYNSTIDPSVNMTLLGDWRTKILDETYTPPVDKNTMDNMTGIIGTLAILMVQLTHHTVLPKKILTMLLMV